MASKPEKMNELEKNEMGMWSRLIGSPEGCWLIRNLVRESRAYQELPYEGGGKDSYNRGRQELVQKYVCDRIRKYFGWSSFDNIMKQGDE